MSLSGLPDTTIQSLDPNLAQIYFCRKFPWPTARRQTASCPTARDWHGGNHFARDFRRQVAAARRRRILPVDCLWARAKTTNELERPRWGFRRRSNRGAKRFEFESRQFPATAAVLDSVIQQAIADGIVVFAAAGNSPVNTPTYPAAIPGVNAVTALQQQGQLASYANYGSFVDMALPGASVIYLNGQGLHRSRHVGFRRLMQQALRREQKTSNCAGWPQIQSAMQQKFTVPQK